MRIADPNSPGNAKPAKPAAPQPPAPSRGAAASASGTIAVGSDRAELSGVADRLSEILQTESGNRAARIEQLKQAVSSGAYHVDAAAISRAMVDEALSTNSGPNPDKK